VQFRNLPEDEANKKKATGKEKVVSLNDVDSGKLNSPSIASCREVYKISFGQKLICNTH